MKVDENFKQDGVEIQLRTCTDHFEVHQYEAGCIKNKPKSFDRYEEAKKVFDYLTRTLRSELRTDRSTIRRQHNIDPNDEPPERIQIPLTDLSRDKTQRPLEFFYVKNRKLYIVNEVESPGNECCDIESRFELKGVNLLVWFETEDGRRFVRTGQTFLNHPVVQRL